MKYFDSHTHTNISPLKEEFSTIVTELKQENIGINIVGTDLKNSRLAIEQSLADENFYCSIGIHPTDIPSTTEIPETIRALKQMYLNNPSKVKCIGECGIDLFHAQENLNEQIEWFKAQLSLAKELKLTLMIHVRNAYEELYNLLSQYDLSDINVIIHCYTGNLDYALKFQAMRCYISIPGIVTFKNATELQRVVQNISIDLMITETDAPWLTPTPFRGKTNYPYYVKYTNHYVANLLKIPENEFNELMIKNIKKVFNI